MLLVLLFGVEGGVVEAVDDDEQIVHIERVRIKQRVQRLDQTLAKQTVGVQFAHVRVDELLEQTGIVFVEYLLVEIDGLAVLIGRGCGRRLFGNYFVETVEISQRPDEIVQELARFPGAFVVVEANMHAGQIGRQIFDLYVGARRRDRLVLEQLRARLSAVQVRIERRARRRCRIDRRVIVIRICVMHIVQIVARLTTKCACILINRRKSKEILYDFCFSCACSAA